MNYTYETGVHQIGRDEHMVMETMFSHAARNKLVVMLDETGLWFSVINPENNRVLGTAHCKEITLYNVEELSK